MSNDDQTKQFEAGPQHAAADGERPIAYVRAVRRDQLPNPPAEAEGETFYAVHDESGRPLAVFKDRQMAHIVARNHDFTPMSVH